MSDNSNKDVHSLGEAWDILQSNMAPSCAL
jgi:hypothetical protein